MITEDFIIYFAGNPSTVANGRALANKGSFSALSETEDGALLFGACSGSGKIPYQCSVDFVDPEKPTPRCTCPSRQIPCKHTIGLLFCKLQGKLFAIKEIPADIATKRAKMKKHIENDTAEKDKPVDPVKAAKSAQASRLAKTKQCRAQLEGIALAEKLLHNIMFSGLHSINAQSQKGYKAQAKELGNYYISGIQSAFTELLNAAAVSQEKQYFTAALDQANYLHSLLKKSRSYIKDKLAYYESGTAEIPADIKDAMIHSRIEEQMGYAWKLSELQDLGLSLENARLIQVGFSVFQDEARKQDVDEGIWLDLDSGALYRSLNFRPLKAQQHIKAEDSFFPLLTTSQLFIYPGDKNPRVRWEKSGQQEVTPSDLQDALKYGVTDFATVIKEVKNQVKSPLADKNPVFALKICRLGMDTAGGVNMLDEKGVPIPLSLDNFSFLIKKISREQAEGGVLICRFNHNTQADISAVPIALITETAVLRFGY
jgi:hypothetical protein